jgi:hypothetical protein
MLEVVAAGQVQQEILAPPSPIQPKVVMDLL